MGQVFLTRGWYNPDVDNKVSISDFQVLASLYTEIVGRVQVLETKINQAYTKVTFSVTIGTSGWSQGSSGETLYYYKDMTLTGLLASDTIYPTVNYSSNENTRINERAAASCYAAFMSNDNKFRVYCGKGGPPQTSLNFVFEVFRPIT